MTQQLGIVLIQIILQLSEISSPTQSTIPSQEHLKRMRRGFIRRVSISSLITWQYLHIRIFFLQIQHNVEMGILGLCVWKVWSQSTIFRVKLMLTNVEYNIIGGYFALTYPIFWCSCTFEQPSNSLHQTISCSGHNLDHTQILLASWKQNIKFRLLISGVITYTLNCGKQK